MLLSGYGLRAWRAIATYLVTLLGISAAIRWSTRTFVTNEHLALGTSNNDSGLSLHHFIDVVAFVARSSVSFLSPPISGLTPSGTVLLLITRFVAPASLALAILAIRARVRR